ncbi:MAG: hypothetical protein EHM77_02625 [Planctomycetaceae bacterium]|nr:MAG: hypothetical protein EHM77_02625 [Planctomycetaceae bacterium]
MADVGFDFPPPIRSRITDSTAVGFPPSDLMTMNRFLPRSRRPSGLLASGVTPGRPSASCGRRSGAGLEIPTIGGGLPEAGPR